MLSRSDSADATHTFGAACRERGNSPTVNHTTLYLDDAETAVLLTLPADAVTKIRTLQPCQGLTVAVDVFAGPLTGLVLAEVDLRENCVLPAAGLPLPWLAEVTDDERFTGGHLARPPAKDLTDLLREFGAVTV